MSKNIKKKSPLTFEQIAKIYNKYNTRSAFIQPMKNIFNWALKRNDLFFYDKDKDLLYLKEIKKG